MKIPEGKWYHEANINGVKMKARRNNDPSEGRWNTFIKPLLPFNKGESRVSIDLGCNAGLYSRKLSDNGYKVTGVEKDKMFIAHARYWEDNDPKGIKIIECDLNEYNIPASSIVILAQVHYWLTSTQLELLVDKLKKRALYVIVVGRHRRVDGSVVKGYEKLSGVVSPTGIDALRNTFSEWELEKTIYGEGINYRHYSVLLKNKDLAEKDIDDLVLYPPVIKYEGLIPAFNKLIDVVITGECIKEAKIDYERYLTLRRYGQREFRVKNHIKLIRNIIKNGIKEPLIIGAMVEGKYNENRIWDGDHRYIIAERLGIKKLICKLIDEEQAKKNETERWNEDWTDEIRDKQFKEKI